MSWFTIAIVGVICLSVSGILQKLLLQDEKSDYYLNAVIFQFLCALLVGVFSATQGFVMPPVKMLPFNFFLSSIMYAAGTLSLFNSLKRVDVSEVTIIFATRSVFVIILAVLFLGEVFGLRQALGTGLIIFAVVLVNFMGYKIKIVSFGSGEKYALLASFFYSVALVNDSYIIHFSEPISFAALMFLLPGIVMVAIKPAVIKGIPGYFKPNTLIKMLLLGIFYSISALAYYIAYKSGGNASQLAPIGQSSIILTVLLALIFLGERKNLFSKILATILVSIGVTLLR